MTTLQVKPPEELLLPEDGDGLELLRRVRTQYYNRANKLAQRITNEYYEGDLTNLREYIRSLRACGDRVNLLIPEDKEFLNVIEAGSQGDGAGSIAIVDAVKL